MNPTESALMYVEQSFLNGTEPQPGAVSVIFFTHPDIVALEVEYQRGKRIPE